MLKSTTNPNCGTAPGLTSDLKVFGRASFGLQACQVDDAYMCNYSWRSYLFFFQFCKVGEHLGLHMGPASTSPVSSPPEVSVTREVTETLQERGSVRFNLHPKSSKCQIT